MKKIISQYYFIIAVLLVIADQFFIRLVLHSDLVAGLSDFAYYLSFVGYDVEFSCCSACYYCYGLVREMAENQQ